MLTSMPGDHLSKELEDAKESMVIQDDEIKRLKSLLEASSKFLLLSEILEACMLQRWPSTPSFLPTRVGESANLTVIDKKAEKLTLDLLDRTEDFDNAAKERDAANAKIGELRDEVKTHKRQAEEVGRFYDGQVTQSYQNAQRLKKVEGENKRLMKKNAELAERLGVDKEPDAIPAALAPAPPLSVVSDAIMAAQAVVDIPEPAKDDFRFRVDAQTTLPGTDPNLHVRIWLALKNVYEDFPRCKNKQMNGRDWLAKAMALVPDLTATPRCMHSFSRQSSNTLWSVDDPAEFACRTCTNAGEPCMLLDRVAKKFIVLPLLPKFRKDAAPEEAGYWVSLAPRLNTQHADLS